MGSDAHVLHKVVISAVHLITINEWLSSFRFVREAVPDFSAALSRIQLVTSASYVLPQAFVAMALMLRSTGARKFLVFALYTAFVYESLLLNV